MSSSDHINVRKDVLFEVDINRKGVPVSFVFWKGNCERNTSCFEVVNVVTTSKWSWQTLASPINIKRPDRNWCSAEFWQTGKTCK